MSYNRRPATTAVKIWWDVEIGAYRLSSSYNEALVKLLQEHIPISDRQFNERSRIWTFSEKWLTPIEALFKQFLNITPNITTRTQAEAHASKKPSSSTSNSPIEAMTIEFVRLVPYGDAQRAYRAAQLIHHPDRGGDAAKAARLNVAWERIKKEIYNQS